MAEGDSFLGFLKDTVNSVPVLGAYTSAAWGPGNWDPNAAPTKDIFSADATAMERIGSVINAVPFMHVLGDATMAATGAPIVGAPLKFVLDFGNRTADSFFTGALAEDDGDDSTSFFDGWRHGWDTFGQEGHLSAGNIVAASINNDFQNLEISPFTQQGADKIREASRETWYGDLAGAVTDLSAGFITPATPVATAAKASRAAKTVDTVAGAEKVAEAFNASAAGSKGFAPLGLSAENQATRLTGMVRETLTHSDSMSDAMNFLGPRMTHAHENAKRILAEVAVTAKKMPADSGEHLMGNAYLAAMGSEAAKAEMIATYPLVAAKIANASLPPQLFDDVAKAQELLADAFKSGGDIRGEQIMAKVYDTPRKKAEQQAIEGLLDLARQDALKARELRSKLASLRPAVRKKVDGRFVDTFDNGRLKEARSNAIAQHDSLRKQLDEAKADLEATSRWAAGANKKVTSKGAMQDAGAAANSKAGRDAVAAFGPYKDAEDFNRALGAAQQKVDDLNARIAEAKADRDLLGSTPLDDAGLEAWRTEMGSARAGTKQAIARRDMLEAMNRTAKRALKDDAAKAKAISPTLNATHNWLADIDALGEGSNVVASMRVTPSRLEVAKTAYRDYVGRSYLYDAGDYTQRTIFHQWPQKAIASIGTDYGRSAIQTLDRYRGQQELAMYLKKSGVYTGDEIRATTEAFLQAQPGQVATVISKVHDDMLERIVLEVAPDMSKADVSKAVGDLKAGMGGSRSYLTAAMQKAEGEGTNWASLQEFPDTTASGAAHRVDAAFLRSHLADTVPFADPMLLRKALKAAQGERGLTQVGRAALGAVDMYTTGWKLANLIRPGLFFRNMMDTGLRAVAIMGTGATMMSVVNGTLNKMRNDGFKAGDWVASRNSKAGTALEKIGLHDPEGAVRHMLGDGGVKVNIGNGKTASPAFYDQGATGHAEFTSMAAMRSALNRGMPFSEGVMNVSQRTLDKFLQNRKVWDVYKADSKEWPRAYAEHAEVLLASPTARKVIEMHAVTAADNFDGPAFVREMFSDPAVREEYSRLARDLDMSREAWLEQVIHETDNMFPEAGMAADLMAGRFKGSRGAQWIEEHFPPELRFDVPGFESIFEHSARNADSARTLIRKTVDNFFRVMMDEPDYWLTRHPVAVNAFSRQVKMEAARLLESRVKQFGPDAELSAKDIKKITERSKVHAVSVVRDYMYDATKNTALSQSLHRVVPFFGPYQDVMRAYGKLIYDDPQRLFKLSGLYNAPTNLNQWMPEPIIVDVNGEPIRPGQVPEQGGGEGFIVLNGVPGFDGALKLRRSSFNTLLQGDVPWLPGWGPAATIPATVALGSNQELALRLSQSEDPFTRTLMTSLFMDGEVPTSGLGDIAKSQVPAWLRRYADSSSGIGYGRNVQYALNQAYISSQEKGVPFDYNSALKGAQEQAKAAAQIQVLAQFGFGISGQAEVQGTFYVQQMHQLQALDEKPPGGGPSMLQQMGYPSAQAAFAAQFPEAANLRWSFTRNETGINATVQAQGAALGLQGLISESPDLGWFIVGADNVGGEWSQTAYNQQKQTGYGISEKGRKVLDPAQMATAVRESFGWDQFTKMNTMLSNLSAQGGYSQSAVARAKAAIVEMIGQENPEWYAAYNDRTNKLQDFYQQADRLVSSPALAKRQDIAMYATYRQAQQEVLASFGLKSLSGTGLNSVKARAVLNQIGSQMARQNIGFQQMWDRMLYNDVKPKASDARFGYVDSAQPNTGVGADA